LNKELFGIAKLSDAAQPTVFHGFMGWLKQENKLQRVFTQNIDGLEIKAGLFTTNQTDALLQGTCVQLHGTVHELRCMHCTNLYRTAFYYGNLSSAPGKAISCNHCVNVVQHTFGRKVQTMHKNLRFNVQLYGEEQFIPQVSHSIPEDIIAADLLIVAGTALEISNAKSMIVAQYLKKEYTMPSIMVEIRPFLQINHAIQKLPFTYWIQADCQEFAKLVLNSLTSTSDSSFNYTFLPRADSRSPSLGLVYKYS
jgi:NAD-dependent SIR2 family protein deacetylase